MPIRHAGQDLRFAQIREPVEHRERTHIVAIAAHVRIENHRDRGGGGHCEQHRGHRYCDEHRHDRCCVLLPQANEV